MKSTVASVFLIAFSFLLLVDFVSAAALTTIPARTIATLPATLPNLTVSANQTAILNASQRLILTTATASISPAAIAAMLEALKSGPMVYEAGEPARVIDSSMQKVVATIKSSEPDSSVAAVGVSPDGAYVYAAIEWTTKTDPYGGEETAHCLVVRLNASTDEPIDQFSIDNIYPTHMAVAPDGKVYLGYQDASEEGYGGVQIFDFSQGKGWYLHYDMTMMMNAFAFSPDGGQIYFAGWWNEPSVYDLDWAANTVHYIQLPGDTSQETVYTRSIAVGDGGKMLYAVVNRDKGIFAMNTEDQGKQIIPTDYFPVTLATSPDGSTLYVIGYFYDQNNKPVYLMYKYVGLKTVGPFHSNLLDFTVTDPGQFYMSDATGFVTVSSGYPSNMVVTGDGAYAYITTATGDGVSNAHGDSVVVFDLSQMTQLPSIAAPGGGFDVAASSAKILFAPPLQVGQFAQHSGMPGLEFLFVKKVSPLNGSFASQYQQDYFTVNAIFTEQLDNTTVNSSTFTVTMKDGTPVPGKVTCAQNIAIFLPDNQLPGDTDYVATLSSVIKSRDGYSLVAPVQWSFTTKLEFMGGAFANLSVVNVSFSTTNVTLIRPPLLGHFTLELPSNQSNASNHTVPQQSGPITQSAGGLGGGGGGGSVGGSPVVPGASGNRSLNVTAFATGSSNVTNAVGPVAVGARPGVTSPSAPSTQGFFGRIVEFFKSLFGMK